MKAGDDGTFRGEEQTVRVETGVNQVKIRMNTACREQERVVRRVGFVGFSPVFTGD